MSESTRTARLNVRLTPDLEQAIKEEAEYSGVPAATLGTIAISNYIKERQTKRVFERQLQTRIANATAKKFLDLIESDPTIAASLLGADASEEQLADARSKLESEGVIT